MPTILIVDDRPVNREYLGTLLDHGQHRLLQAADGAEALALARAEHPDLVITDILMPTMDGYEFVRQLRTDPAGARIPVIFYTAHYHEPEARNLANACGVTAVLTKPFEPEVMLSMVNAALGVPQRPAQAPSADEFDREHLRVLTDKLSQKVDELRRTNARLNALVDLGLYLGSNRNCRLVLQSFCDAAREIVGARYAVVGVLEGEAPHFRYLVSSGMDRATADRLGSLKPRQGVLGAILQECRCCRLNNTNGAAEDFGLAPAIPAIHSFLGAPVVSPNRVYGWLGLIDKVGADEFTPEDERLAGILAAQVGRVYENGSLYGGDALNHATQLEREIAERERAEEALREREERIRLLLDSTVEAICGTDLQGNCTFSNPACARLLGYAEPGQLAGKNMHALVHHHRADGTPYPQEECQIVRAVQRGEGAHVDDEVFWRADGTSFAVEYWSFPIRRGDQIIGTVVTFWDISERKSLEEQLRQAQKMEAIGRLAGGVAHDFNNLLTVINGYGEMLLGVLPAADPNRDMIREMVAAGNRAAILTRQLLLFSRKAISEPKVLDVKAVVADMEKMLRRIIGEDIQLATVADPDLGAVKADVGHIEQVILNLVVNARDAMPQGGQLTIELHNVELDAAYARVHQGTQPGAYVLLAVSDTGCGMDTATLARIWEPCFTTKGERGTGLGLATVYGIVKQSGGHASVYSEVDKGATFKIYLPQVAQRPVSGKSHARLAALPHGQETVLLVEDDAGVRALTRRTLQDCGYPVLAARDGAQATQVAEEHPGRIDLLISDVVMPRLSGREVAERLAALHPGIKVLFLSGYTDDAVVRHGILEAQVAFLQKPFTLVALAAKVREVLDGQ
jgi:PAS domain S-box-containing protein